MEKKAQVWVETVIYTLIAFSLIAAVLAFAKPKIDEAQDKAIIEQSIGMMKQIDSTIRDVQSVSGNKRILDIAIKDGSLIINGEEDSISFEIDSKYQYSEVGTDIPDGNLIIKTEEKGSDYYVKIKYSKSNINITYGLEEGEKRFAKAGTSYKISFTNKGTIGEKLNIDIGLG